MTSPVHPYKPSADLSKFYVITPISNPRRFARRYELYHLFKEEMTNAGINLITVEQAFGERPFMVTSPTDKMNVQVRSFEELWHKECQITIGIKKAVELGAEYVAWIDADCRYAGITRDWVEETYQMLQHHHFVQMWENMVDLDLNNNPVGGPQPSFMANYVKYGNPNPEQFRKIEAAAASKGWASYYDPAIVKDGKLEVSRIFGRPGLAWAATVEAMNLVGGMIDFSILGAGDWYQAHGLVGSMVVTAGEQYSAAYSAKLMAWQDRANHFIKRDVGFVKGTVFHYYHGDKVNRQYNTRGQILKDGNYDPTTDITYDAQGLLQLVVMDDRQIKMRDAIRAYFQARNEDQQP